MATTKHLSYCGVTLPLPTPQLERDYLRVIQNPYSFTDLFGPNFSTPNRTTVPTPPFPVPPEFRLNTLTWYTGASKPAWFHFVCESSRLEAIYTALGPTAVPAPLYFQDGRTGHEVTAYLRMLPPRPLQVSCGTSSEQFWLVTLTDERFFWFQRRGTVTAPTSWANLFTQIGTLLGVSISVDTINAGYGTPTQKWATFQESPGALLDAAAYSVGQRVVVGLDGTVRTRNWETAMGLSDLQFTTGSTVVSGGKVSRAGIVRCAPASVNTVFGRLTDGGTLDPSPFVVSTSITVAAPSEYGSATGLPGMADTVWADGVLAANLSNTTALTTLAAAASQDAYGWRLSDPDAAWPGIEPWIPTGWEERIEWTLKCVENPDDPTDGQGVPFALTTVRRGPWQEFVLGDYSNGYRPAAPCADGLSPGCVPAGSGSGSGSGSGCGPNGYCDLAVYTTEVVYDGGARTLRAHSVDLASDCGRLEVVRCDSHDYPLGAYDPDYPYGYGLPVVTRVCPVKTTLDQTRLQAILDGDETLDVVTDVVSYRQFVVVPVAGQVGCYTFTQDECCGSGSGSGGGCPETPECSVVCEPCVTGAPTQWRLVFDPEDVGGTTLCFDPTVGTGDPCRWFSVDLDWYLYHDPDSGAWVLQRFSTGDLWAVFEGGWDCFPSAELYNTLVSADGGADAYLFAVPCPTRYECAAGECIESVEGVYATLAACQAACAHPVTTTCCPDDPIQSQVYAHISGGTGDCAEFDGTVIALTNTTGGNVWANGGHRFECVLGIGWQLTLDGGGFVFGPFVQASYDCAPLSVVFTGTVSSGCTGDITVTVTTSPTPP